LQAKTRVAHKTHKESASSARVLAHNSRKRSLNGNTDLSLEKEKEYVSNLIVKNF